MLQCVAVFGMLQFVAVPRLTTPLPELATVRVCCSMF